MGRSLGGEWGGVGTQEENTAEMKVSSPAQCVPQEGQVIDVLGRSWYIEPHDQDSAHCLLQCLS